MTEEMTTSRIDPLDGIADDVGQIAATWLETGLGIALAALGAVGDALCTTGEALGRLSEHLGDVGEMDRADVEAPDHD